MKFCLHVLFLVVSLVKFAGMLTEQCFSELIKSGFNLPPLTSIDNSSFLNDPLHALDCTNFENNNTAKFYSDSGL